jgi:hypothetical protein
LPAPGLATIAFAESLAGSVRPLSEKADRKAAPRTSRWPQRTPAPSVIDMAAREELPAPNPESFGYNNMIEAKPATPDRRAAAAPTDPSASQPAPAPRLPGDITGSLRPSLGLWPRTTFGLSKSAYP